MRTSMELDVAGELRRTMTSGLTALIGRPEGPPLDPPPGLVDALDRLAVEIGRWSETAGTRVAVDWATLLTTRARLLGLRRQGRCSANGTCRLLRGNEGWVALNLPRPEDRASVAPMLETDGGGDPWEALQQALDHRPAAEVVARARLLGVPAAMLGSVHADGRALPWTEQHRWPSVAPRPLDRLRVVDLSSMWAGPLAAMLLAGAGATVVKVESRSRPDAARSTPAFYRTLHPPQQPEVVVDVTGEHGRRHLRALVEEADVVIESSRRRALEQLGTGPGDVAARPGRVWVSITGYGRSVPGRDWVAFGDDAAVAGGLVAWEQADLPVFCGDAVADPVTGLVAAWAALQAIATGGGALLDVAMSHCAAWLVRGSPGVG